MVNLARIKNFFKSTTTAHAHCDVPCGIYQPDDAVQAADTAIKMVEFILEAYEQEDSIEKANKAITYPQVFQARPFCQVIPGTEQPDKVDT